MYAVLQTPEVTLQLARPLFWQRVDHPISVARCYYHSPVSKIAQMLRDFHLWLPENILEMTDAERRSGKKMEDAQPSTVAKALINLEQVHLV